MQTQKLARNIVLAFVFFAIGRLIVMQMGNTGIWLVFGLVVIFYTAWWFFRRQSR